MTLYLGHIDRGAKQHLGLAADDDAVVALGVVVLGPDHFRQATGRSTCPESRSVMAGPAPRLFCRQATRTRPTVPSAVRPGRQRSAPDHAHKNTVPPHEVMIKGGPHIHSHKSRVPPSTH